MYSSSCILWTSHLKSSWPSCLDFFFMGISQSEGPFYTPPHNHRNPNDRDLSKTLIVCEMPQPRPNSYYAIPLVNLVLHLLVHSSVHFTTLNLAPTALKPWPVLRKLPMSAGSPPLCMARPWEHEPAEEFGLSREVSGNHAFFAGA